MASNDEIDLGNEVFFDPSDKEAPICLDLTDVSGWMDIEAARKVGASLQKAIELTEKKWPDLARDPGAQERKEP
jgi:hypothetical protein